MAKASRDLEKRLKNLERWLDAVTPAESVQTHVRGLDGTITPPLSTDEREGRKPCIIAQAIDGRSKH